MEGNLKYEIDKVGTGVSMWSLLILYRLDQAHARLWGWLLVVVFVGALLGVIVESIRRRL